MYRVRRGRVSPRRIVVGVEVDLEVAGPRSDTVVQRAPVANRQLSVGRPEVERRRLRERATPRTAQQSEEEQTEDGYFFGVRQWIHCHSALTFALHKALGDVDN